MNVGIDSENRVGIGLGIGLPMLHKMLIFKRGINFSSIRRATQFPTLFLEEEGRYTLFLKESIPTGIDSEIGNQILESSPKFIFV